MPHDARIFTKTELDSFIAQVMKPGIYGELHFNVNDGKIKDLWVKIAHKPKKDT